MVPPPDHEPATLSKLCSARAGTAAKNGHQEQASQDAMPTLPDCETLSFVLVGAIAIGPVSGCH